MPDQFLKIASEQGGIVGFFATIMIGLLGWVGSHASKSIQRTNERVEALERTIITRTEFADHVEKIEATHVRVFNKLDGIGESVAKIKGYCEATHMIERNNDHH